MINSGNAKKRSTTGSALLIVLLAALIAGMIAGIVIFFAFNPDMLASLAVIAAVIAAAIVIIILAIYAATVLLALPYYAAKGESYQTDASYDLNDVRPVKEKDSEKKEDP